MRTVTAVALGLTLAASPAAAQDGATIAGRVVYKSSKAGIADAELRLVPGGQMLMSDDAGHFRFDHVAPGVISMFVRRIGFAPESASFDVRPKDDIDVLVELSAVPQQLDTVNVAASETPLARGKLAGFYERKRMGIGKFIEAAELEQAFGQRLGDVITLRTPGVKLVRARIGFISWLATNRDAGVRPTGGVLLDDVDRRLGADPTACYPDVWLDGSKLYAFGSGMRLFDINSLAISEVAAIEFYVGAARIPVQYNSSSSNCGVLLIWTK